MTTLYEALGGEATVVELAVLTALRVTESAMPTEWRSAADHLVTDEDRLAAHWSRMLGGPHDNAYDGPLYLLSATAHDERLAVWVLEDCVTQAARETVVRSSRARAVMTAMVSWDLREAVDQLAPTPLLPTRRGVPVWGWEGPEDVGSLDRQSVLLQRIRAAALRVLRAGDPPADTALEWITTEAVRWSSGGLVDEMQTELFFTLEVEGESGCHCWVPRPPVVDTDELDEVGSTVADWVSTDTGFGWGRQVPDLELSDERSGRSGAGGVDEVGGGVG